MIATLIATAFLSASPAAAQAEAPAQQDAASERRICRMQEDTVARARRTRVCRTAAEWRQIDRGGQDGAEVQRVGR